MKLEEKQNKMFDNSSNLEINLCIMYADTADAGCISSKI